MTVAIAEPLRAPRLSGIDAVASAIKQYLAPVAIEPVHRFADGLYAREITIPAGTLLVGKVHRTRHLNIVSRGRISVWSANEGVRHITAPFSFVAEPGSQRLGFAHEDTVWTTVHATHETDLGVLEATLVEPYAIPDADAAAIIEALQRPMLEIER